IDGLKVYFLQVTSSGTFASAMMSTKTELNQSPGGTPNLESPGESYEPLKFRERATGQWDPRDEANLHRQLRRPSILYFLESSSRDDQLSCSDHLHRRPLREDMGIQRNEQKKRGLPRGPTTDRHVAAVANNRATRVAG